MIRCNCTSKDRINIGSSNHQTAIDEDTKGFIKSPRCRFHIEVVHLCLRTTEHNIDFFIKVLSNCNVSYELVNKYVKETIKTNLVIGYDKQEKKYFIQSASELSRLVFVSKIPEMLDKFVPKSNYSMQIGKFGKKKKNQYLMNSFNDTLSSQILILKEALGKHRERYWYETKFIQSSSFFQNSIKKLLETKENRIKKIQTDEKALSEEYFEMLKQHSEDLLVILEFSRHSNSASTTIFENKLNKSEYIQIKKLLESKFNSFYLEYSLHDLSFNEMISFFDIFIHCFLYDLVFLKGDFIGDYSHILTHIVQDIRETLLPLIVNSSSVLELKFHAYKYLFKTGTDLRKSSSNYLNCFEKVYLSRTTKSELQIIHELSQLPKNLEEQDEFLRENKTIYFNNKKISKKDLPFFLKFTEEELSQYQLILSVLKDYYSTDLELKRTTVISKKNTEYKTYKVTPREIKDEIESLPIEFNSTIQENIGVNQFEKIIYPPWVDNNKKKKLSDIIFNVIKKKLNFEEIHNFFEK